MKMEECFQCGDNLDNKSTKLTDGYNDYNFCNIECERIFIESQSRNNDGIYQSYESK